MDNRRPRGGHARGRGLQRPDPSQQQQQQGGSQQGGSQPPQLQGAWARRPGPSQQQQEKPSYSGGGPPPSAGRAVRAPVPQQSWPHGDRPGSDRPMPPSSSSTDPGGPGGDAGSSVVAGRGAMRGRRPINPDILNTRPVHTQASKKGNIGAPIRLESNFFKVLSAPDWCLYQYRVDFAPEEDRTVVRRGLLRLHKERLGAYMFDGTVMYSCNRYPNVTANDAMKLYSKRTSDDTNVEISIRLVGEMTKGDPHYPTFYNIIMRRALEHLRLQLVGRNYFDAQAKIEIREHHFELWPGYDTSIRQHEHHVLLGVEITSKVMRQETLLQILNNARHNAGGRDIQAACRAEVIGLTVLTDYNNNTYRVDDIDFNQTPKDSFSIRKRGEPGQTEAISFVDYYMKKYNITIRNLNQPLLITRPSIRDRRSGKDETLVLIPELCRATGLTDRMRNDFRLMNALAEHTRIGPNVRIDRLLQFNRRLQSEKAVVDDFREWHLQLDQKLIEINARVLPTETIRFGMKQESAGRECDWGRPIQSNKAAVGKDLKDWVVLCPERCARDAEGFLKLIVQAGMGMSLHIGRPTIHTLRGDQPQAYAEELENVMRRQNPQLVCCIALRQRADVYSAIKKKCCVDRPVPSQVILSKQFGNKKPLSIATKIAVQLNCKMGGAPWTMDLGAPGLMVVGFDVCHDPAQRGIDIGAMVASLDRGCMRYFSAVSAHRSSEELTNEFSANMVKAIRKYEEINHQQLPDQIVIYRDGVGDGQIPYVLEHEVKNIREALEKFYPPPKQLKMAFIIVTKRISVRLFYNRRENPPAGTVVDDVITNPCRYDFFLVSQFVRKGSVSPSAYNVIYDNSGLSVSAIQQLSFRLTHMYYNWCGTVRVPAPCQYAHKLAFLVSQSIHSPPSSHLETLLYFL